MSRILIKRFLYLIPSAALLAGCTQTDSENRGEYHKAYDLYLKQLSSSPVNPGAAAGLKRTAPLAAAYWQRQAYEAAEAGLWRQAAACHKKVLEIKPNELGSILSLRQMARHHPDEVALVYGRDLRTEPAIAQAPPVTPLPEPTPPVAVPPKVEPAPARPEPSPTIAPEKPVTVTPRPQPEPEPVKPEPTPAQATPEPQPEKPLPTPPEPKPKPATPGPPPQEAKPKPKPLEQKPKPAAEPKPHPVEQKPKPPQPKAPAAKAKPATTQPSPAPVKPPSAPPPPALPKIDPFKQKATVRPSRGASGGEFIMVVRISREDRRYPKMAPLQDGLAVKIKDTDRQPLDADVEVYLHTKRIAKLKDLPIDSVISVIGRSRGQYEIVVMNIYDPTETVTVGLRRPEPSPPTKKPPT